jgi:hypothetical protein
MDNAEIAWLWLAVAFALGAVLGTSLGVLVFALTRANGPADAVDDSGSDRDAH